MTEINRRQDFRIYLTLHRRFAAAKADRRCHDEGSRAVNGTASENVSDDIIRIAAAHVRCAGAGPADHLVFEKLADRTGCLVH